MSWELRPLYRIIYSLLKKRKSMTYDNLLKEIRNYSGYISENELKNALIKLELWGKIDVISIDEKHIKIVLRE